VALHCFILKLIEMNIKEHFKNNYEQYSKDFSENWLWKRLKNNAKSIGIGVIYPVLLLFYAFKRKDTPGWAKKVITGALGYFLIPFDIIPDPLIPIIGFTDDIIVLSVAMMVVTAYIDTDVVERARTKLTTWFGTYDASRLDEIDNAAKNGDTETTEDA